MLRSHKSLRYPAFLFSEGRRWSHELWLKKGTGIERSQKAWDNEMRHRYTGSFPCVEEPIVCKKSDRCKGCPFPGHGFLCWGKDDECMRTRLAEIENRRKSE